MKTVINSCQISNAVHKYYLLIQGRTAAAVKFTNACPLRMHRDGLQCEKLLGYKIKFELETGVTRLCMSVIDTEGNHPEG